MPKVVTPVLSASAGYEDDIPTQIAARLRWFIYNPAATSDLWEGNLVSFPYLVAKYENDPHTLAYESRSALQRTLSHTFADCEFNVTVDVKTKTKDDVNYKLAFSITFTKKGESIVHSGLVAGMIIVDPETSYIQINFTSSR